MNPNVNIIVNGENISITSVSNIVVKDRDEIQIAVLVPQTMIAPCLYIGGQLCELIEGERSDAGVVYLSRAGAIFRDVFGVSVVRLEWDKSFTELIFDVIVHKSQAVQIEDMIKYLMSHSESMIRVCLTKSKTGAVVDESEIGDHETALTMIETLVTTLESSRNEFLGQGKRRLVQEKINTSEFNSQEHHIDISDLFENLDALVPCDGHGDVKIHGRQYQISGLRVTSMRHTQDVFENSVIVGGLVSMKVWVEKLLQKIQTNQSIYPDTSKDIDYVCLSEVLSRVTIGNIRVRSHDVINNLDELFRFFKNDIGVTFKGAISPVMTPFVRSSRIYRVLFEQIQEWYLRGSPSMLGVQLLSQLRSVSKIYEFYVLFQLLEYFLARNWSLEYARQQPTEGNLIPEQVDFEMGDQKISILFDLPIAPWSENTKNNDLVDLKHSYFNREYWYRPDFVIRYEVGAKVRYFVLDAKYSTLGTVENQSLPDLLTKYFLDTGVYDATRNQIRSDQILAVIAVFPGSASARGVWSYYKAQPKPEVLRLPYAAAVSMSPQDDSLITRVMDLLIDLGMRETVNT